LLCFLSFFFFLFVWIGVGNQIPDGIFLHPDGIANESKRI
jgi:hypothetical protein